MKLTGYYPVIQTRAVEETARFYEALLGFERSFAADWYIHLKSIDDARVELAILAEGHETVPEAGRGATRCLILNVEVEAVEDVLERFEAHGATIVQALRDEDFGQRHFIARDPAGTLVDVITPIPMRGSFAEA